MNDTNRVGIRWVNKGNDLQTIENYNLAFSSPDYQNLMVYGKGITHDELIIPHDLGYPPTYNAYFKSGNKYFFNYNSEVMTDYQFEKPSGKGFIKSNSESIYCTVDSNELAYIVYANPSRPQDGSTNPSTQRSGIKFAKRLYDVRDGLGRRSFDTSYQMPIVIKSIMISVTIPAITVAFNSEAYQTDFSDFYHQQNQANHIVSPRFLDRATYAMSSPFPTGFDPTRQDLSYELYVDDQKIRLRVSRAIYNYNVLLPNPYSVDAIETVIPIYLTNIALPK